MFRGPGSLSGVGLETFTGWEVPTPHQSHLNGITLPQNYIIQNGIPKHRFITSIMKLMKFNVSFNNVVKFIFRPLSAPYVAVYRKVNVNYAVYWVYQMNMTAC